MFKTICVAQGIQSPNIQLLLYEVNGNFVFGFRENTIHICCGGEMTTIFS